MASFFRILTLLVILLSPLLSEARNLRLVFRSRNADEYRELLKQIPERLHKVLRKNTMGLSERKITALQELSGRKVDFSGIYSLDLPELEIGPFKKIKYLSSIIYPDVKPPIFLADPEAQVPDARWWLDAINVQPAWDAGYSGAGVTIADCDSGFYIHESDIKNNLLLDLARDLSDRENPLVVDDGNFISHGTSVTSIMAGVKDDRGTSGIAYNAKVVPLQNFNYDRRIDDLDKEEATAQCILHALQIPSVKIIVLENQTAFGSSESYAGTREAVRLAISSGVVILSAAGNASTQLSAEVEDDTGSILVGALDRQGNQADFSNYGPLLAQGEQKRVSIAAFGEDLWTLSGPSGAFDNFGGTSGALPQVGGAAALMLEANPMLLHSHVKTVLENTRVNSPSTVAVGGRLDVAKAVTEAKNLVVPQSQAALAASFRQAAVQILRGN